MDTWVLIVGFVLLVGLVAIGLWVFSRQVAGGASTARPATARVAPTAAHVPPPAPTPAKVPAAAQPLSTPTPRRFSLYPVRHATVSSAPAKPAAAPAAPTGFRSFGPAPTTNSAAKPPSS